MCGIGGLSTAGPFTRRQAEMCIRLLASLTRRGTDAWGYFDGTTVYKEPGDFKESEKYETLADELYAAGTDIFLCHTRRATRGDPRVNKNNHPFRLDPFILAHNGVLFATEDFENKWGIETDSFWMLYWIWEEYQRLGDVPEAIDEGVDHVMGVYACWLHDMDSRTTYLFRMENPIVETVAHVETGMAMFGSDVQSLLDGLGWRGLPWRKKPRFARLRPAMIYRMEAGEIRRVKFFTPGLLSPLQLARFTELQGDLARYCTPGLPYL